MPEMLKAITSFLIEVGRESKNEEKKQDTKLKEKLE